MKRYIQAFLSMALFFAVTHVFVLVFLIILTGNISYLNVFYILGLTELFPDIDKGLVSNMFSALIIFSVYMFFFLRVKRKK